MNDINTKIINSNRCKYQMTEEHKQHIIASHKGKHHIEETRKKIRDNHVGMTGKHHTDETKKKMRDNHAGGMTGKHHTEDTKQKISRGNKERDFHNSIEYRQKISRANTGKKHPTMIGRPSPRKGKHCSEETKRKIGESHRGIPMPAHVYPLTLRGYLIVVNGIEFESVKAAARFFGIRYSTFIFHIHRYGSLINFDLHLNFISAKILKKESERMLVRLNGGSTFL